MEEYNKMKYLKNEEHDVVMEITGETHTICNILRKRLMAQDTISAAAYDITHPLIGQPEFEVVGDNPKESIIAACESIKTEAANFQDGVINAFHA